MGVGVRRIAEYGTTRISCTYTHQIEVVWSIKGDHNIAVECRTKADMSPMATGQLLQLVLHRLEEEL